MRHSFHFDPHDWCTDCRGRAAGQVASAGPEAVKHAQFEQANSYCLLSQCKMRRKDYKGARAALAQAKAVFAALNDEGGIKNCEMAGGVIDEAEAGKGKGR